MVQIMKAGWNTRPDEMREKAELLMGMKGQSDGGEQPVKMKCGGTTKVKKFAAGGAAKVRLKEATQKGKPLKQPKPVKGGC